MRASSGAATSATDLDALPSTEDAARDMLEQARWPAGAHCPRCGTGAPYRLMPKPGSTTRRDVWKCRACRRQFTVSVGTILQASHVKRTVWLKAIYLLCSSGRPMPVHQLHEILGVHYDTATSMMHRVRYALAQATPFALDRRPTLDFHQALERILAAPPNGAVRQDASPAVAWSAGVP